MNEAGALPIVPITVGYNRPDWAWRLFRKLAAKHDLNHFTGCAWVVRCPENKPNEAWLERKATNGDVLRFEAPTGLDAKPRVAYYKKEAT